LKEPAGIFFILDSVTTMVIVPWSYLLGRRRVDPSGGAV